MNTKYNNMMLCITIAICFIVVISIGYNAIEHINKNSVTEHFENDELKVYQYKNELIPRLLSDPEVKQHLIKIQKNIYHDNKTSVTNAGENIDISGINLLPQKINYLSDKVNNLTKLYNKNKYDLDKTIINKSNLSADFDNFNSNNILLKNKIKAYQDTINTLKKKGSNFNVKILKNMFTNKELSIKFITKDNNEIELYYLSINNGCLNIESKGNYNINSCDKSNYKQLFTLNKIDNYTQYNHKIGMGEQINSTKYVTKDDNVKYPFYILCPYTIPGHCVTYNKSNLSVRPINNDIYQRFSVIMTSTACN